MKTGEIKNNIGDLEAVILRPRITEKASDKTGENVYIFEVSPRASKTQIKEAVKNIYKVDALKINICKIQSKKIFSRGRKGVKSGGKKAIVYLKKEDKIETI